MTKTSLDSYILENGLTIYFYEDKRKHSSFFDYVTMFGGLTKDFISDGKEYHLPDGVAHVLEHYLAEETEVGGMCKVLSEKGMDTNATTSLKTTSYYFEAVEEFLFGINTVLKAVHTPLFSEETLERVKKPIYEELRMMKDKKTRNLDRVIRKNLFHNIEFNDVGGTEEEVESITLDTLKVCYDTFYQPKNQFIVVSGNFDKEEVIHTIETFFQGVKKEYPTFEVIHPTEEKTVSTQRDTYIYPTAETFLDISYKINICHLTAEEKIKLDFYLHYAFSLLFGRTSKAYRFLVEEQIITGNIRSRDITLEDYLIISLGAYTSKPERLEEVLRKTIVEKEDLDEEMFDILKKNSIVSIAIRPDYPGKVIFPFIDNLVEYDFPYLDTVDMIKEYSYEDFKKMISSLDLTNYTITTLVNPKE